jgi:membrane protease YdiL (CAAX protease family)
MSAHVARRVPEVFAPWAVALAGLAVLVARPFVGTTPDGRVVLFASAYAAIAVAAIAVPAESERPPLRPPLVLALGLMAIAVSALAAGAPVPAPWASAALPLSLLAAVAEEALFRRVLYSRLARFGVAVAIIGSAAMFAAVHAPSYGVAVLPVNLGAGLLFGWQRWASGSWVVPAATHAAANLWVVLG